MTTAPPLDRRSLLAAGGVSAAALAAGPLLAGCGAAAGGKGSAANKSTLAKLLPEHHPRQAVRPDIPGVDGSTPGYLSYPSTQRTTVSGRPGKGSTFTAMTPAWWALPPGLGSNAYYSAVNKALGATIKFNVLDGNDYGTKLQAILGAKDIPHWTCIPGWNIPANFGEAVDPLFADLTPYLSGSAVTRYPNLANIPTGAWQRCVFNDKLHALPFPAGNFDNPFFYRKDLFDKLGVEPPTTADEMYQLAKKVTDPAKNRWACGYMPVAVQRMFGCWPTSPGWRKDGSGKLVHAYESDRFEAAVAFSRKLFAAGVVHPAAKASTGDAQAKQHFESGKMLFYQDGIGAWHEAVQRQASINPSFDMQAFAPIAADGGTPVWYASQPANTFSFIDKRMSKSRIEEMLALADFIAAPFGSSEFTLVNYGKEGVDYRLDSSGAPKLTDKGSKEVTFTYQFLVEPPVVEAHLQYQQFVKDYCAWEAAAIKYLRKDPFWGMTITEPSQYSKAHQVVDDTVIDITRGRAPMSELKSAVATWRKQGGDALRDFYAKILKNADK